jgi:hypothetical protein
MSFMPLPPKDPLHYPFNRRLGGPQSQSGCIGEDKNLLPLPGMEIIFLGRPANSLVTILTMLSKLWFYLNLFILSMKTVLTLSQPCKYGGRILLWKFYRTYPYLYCPLCSLNSVMWTAWLMKLEHGKCNCIWKENLFREMKLKEAVDLCVIKVWYRNN